ncbi:MAG TPA: hypothetical protein VNT57_04220 [Desulfobacteria bacterium]|nr:hypothetical protein [Desulfobacteria bacterium]
MIEMCMSVVFAVDFKESDENAIKEKVMELGNVYQYGVSIGPENLHPEVKDILPALLSEPQMLFEVHDMPEQHCACDIDQDIRNGSKTGRKSKFFDFVREISESGSITSLAVMFFEEELPDEFNIRKYYGGLEEFVQLLNRWNTWQVERFEPIRGAYEIADSTPMLYTFTEKALPN